MNPLTNSQKGIILLKVLLFSYIITAVMLLILAGIVLKADIPQTAVNIAIILIYIIATFAGGHIAGKSIGNQKFLWGLCLGGAYFVILLIVSLIVNHSTISMSSSIFTTIAL